MVTKLSWEMDQEVWSYWKRDRPEAGTTELLKEALDEAVGDAVISDTRRHIEDGRRHAAKPSLGPERKKKVQLTAMLDSELVARAVRHTGATDMGEVLPVAIVCSSAFTRGDEFKAGWLAGGPGLQGAWEVAVEELNRDANGPEDLGEQISTVSGQSSNIS